MIMLKVPKFKPIECDCGCKFEYEFGEDMVDVVISNQKPYKRFIIRCPLCEEEHILEPIVEDPNKNSEEVDLGCVIISLLQQ